MNLSDLWTEIEAVPLSANIYDVFEKLCQHPEWPLLPVLDEHRRPVGIVREFDLKSYAYSRFGRELIKRHPLAEFLKPVLVLQSQISMQHLLEAAAKNPTSDGIALMERGEYRAMLLPQALLRLFEHDHLENERRLAQAQKMEAIGTLAGGIAHDLNNILTPIIGYADMMTDMLKSGEPLEADMLDQIRVSALRAQAVVRQILAISRHQKSELLPVQLSLLIKEALRLLRSSLPATIEIEMCLTDSETTVLANPAELHRVLLNLCTNAAHAMRTGGHLRLTLQAHSGSLLGWSPQPERLSCDYVRLSVSDTGTGIPADILSRIFEPFYTTKKQGEGTGLGLSIVHGIITRYKGLISVETEVGRGTQFHIYLPLHIATEEGALAQNHVIVAPATKTTTHPIHALMVDDEFAITQLASRMLPRYGITVETENDSRKALQLLRERGKEIDLLITDQTMPGFTGMQLARQALEMLPTLPIILCTGYSEIVSPNEAHDAGIREYLLKPMDFPQVANLIKKMVLPAAA